MMGWRPDQRITVCIVYVIGMFMVSMDGTIVNVILPVIASDYHILPGATSGINVGYLVSLAVVLPVAGWLGDRFGTKRIFLSALAIFTAASFLCGIAWNLQALNWFRIMQGVGGGLLTPVGMAILFRTFPPQERGKVSRMLVLPIAFAPALGPVVGGLFAEQLSWRWAFYINVPLGLAALLFGILFLKEHKELRAGCLDIPGFLLSAFGFSLIMYTLNLGPARGWDSPVILLTGMIGLILILLFILTEVRVKKPMLDLSLFSNRMFRTLGLIHMGAMAGLMGMLYVFPLMYQNAVQASALESGLATFPEALGLMVSSRLMPWTSKKMGTHQMIWGGLLGTCIVFVLISLFGTTANPWFLRFLLFSVGIFLGHTVVSVQATIFNSIPSASIGMATTLSNVQNRMGSAMGVASLASLLGMGTSSSTGDVINLAFYQLALIGSAGFILIALFFSIRLKKADFTLPAKGEGTGTLGTVPAKQVSE